MATKTLELLPVPKKLLSVKAIERYAEANPDRKVVCGDEHRCLVAQYLADTVPGAKYAEVDGYSYRVTNKKPSSYADYDVIDDSDDDGWTSLPDNIRALVGRFDALADDPYSGTLKRVKLGALKALGVFSHKATKETAF